MPLNQFHIQEDEIVRSQHMTDEEAQEVIRLWAEREREREKLASTPTVHAVAEGLDVPPEEVLQLLQEVRARHSAAQARRTSLPLQTQPGLLRQILTVGALLLLSGIVAILIVRMLRVYPEPTATVDTPPETIIKTPDGTVVIQHHEPPEPPAIPPPPEPQ
jgi:hypothetical protein